MTQYGFYFNSASCTGCKTCQVACKEYHKLSGRTLYRHVLNYAGGSWEETASGHHVPKDVFGYFVSMSCNHCAEPACVANCPTGAMQKDPETGIVWTDHTVCIGCGTCASTCPYGAPMVDPDANYAVKCDMCMAEQHLGRKPVCVAACPMRALDFGEFSELQAKYGAGNVNIEPLPADTTGPCTVINPHPAAQESGSGTGATVTLDEEV